MTENEILKDLQNYQGILKAKTRINAGVNPEIALNAVTEAIDIIEQYRAIGTVKEIKIREAQFARLSEGYLSDLTSLREYQAIGTIEEFKALKEKNTPKKGIPYTSSNNHKFVECPGCHKDMDLYYDFCQHCGQSVDWGKTKT